ncbi:MAG: chorismate synthase [Firmicutes bacterium]|nr:chorismate synthase [Bacillota bacterium]
MASTYGRRIKITVDGTSHGKAVTTEIRGIPEGTVIDYRELDAFMARRSAASFGGSYFVTDRKEPDEVIWKEGVTNFGGQFGIVTGPEIKAEVLNTDVRSQDYDELKYRPRPGHADFTLMMKDGLEAETSGGGRASARLTVGLVIAGGIIKQLLEKEGIQVMAEIVEIGGEKDPMGFEEVVQAAAANGDSVGGIVECGIMGLKPGSCGDVYFDGLEGRISEAVFAIPAVKGIEFGSGFEGTRMRGSFHNDPFTFDPDGNVVTTSNNHGGILGGIASGMPIVFRTAFKPTPSVAMKQKTVDLKTQTPVIIEVKGRHDPCVVLRAVPVVEAAAAMAIYDALLYERQGAPVDETPAETEQKILKKSSPSTIEGLREEIDEENRLIMEALDRRLEAARKIGKIKAEQGLPVRDQAREEDILSGLKPYQQEVMKKIMEISRDQQSMPFGLLGRGLGHSLSPVLHEMISKETGHEYEYVLFDKEPEELEDFIRNGSWAGLNVTMPYKTEVMKYLDELSPEAQAIGAVNTIVRRNGRLKGFNTDYFGLKKMLEKHGVEVRDKKCLILGNGGASKAAAQVLFDKGASQVNVLTHQAISEGKALKENRDAQILVNATPVGMYPEEDPSPANPGAFPKLEWAVDLIYNPLRTSFVCQAEKNLIDAVPGLDMFVYQGIYSAMLFTTLKFDDKDGMEERIAGRIRGFRENLVFIGMPGAGKTMIGQAMAEKLGREFVDTDEMIELRNGMTIPELIKEYGEDSFRDMEVMAAEEAGKYTGVVISTGGGIVNREENYYQLARNGRIVFLDKDVKVLEVGGRPLSLSTGVERLYEMRLPLYESWADERVTVEGDDPSANADRILKKLNMM